MNKSIQLTYLSSLRLLWLFILSIFISSLAQGQDLIQRTMTGINSQQRSATVNVLAEKIQQEKEQQAFEKINLFDISEKTQARNYTKYVEGAIFLTIDERKFSKFRTEKPKAISLTIPVVARRNIEVELTEAELSPDEFSISTSDGQSFSSASLGATFYRGIIKGDQQSLVALTITDNRMTLTLSDYYGNYELTQLNNQSSEYILYNSSRLKDQPTYSCAVEDDERFGKYIGNANANAAVNELVANNPVDRCVPIYLEVAHQMYLDKGNDLNAVVAHIVEVFNATATIYQNEQITIGISEIFVHTTPGPYHEISDGFQVHDLVAITNQNDYNGRLAILFSTQDYGGLGGVAWLNVLCARYDDYLNAGPYSLCRILQDVMPFPTYNQDVGIFSHEVGHLFGSRHTHGCYWNDNGTSIDNCGNIPILTNGIDDDDNGVIDNIEELQLTEGAPCADVNNPIYPTNGTIMSYCHLPIEGVNSGINFSAGFGPQPGDLIRFSLSTSSNCLISCTCPFHLTVNDNAVNTDQRADFSITTNGTVNVTGNVTFGAYENITLNPGFSTTPNTTFRAELEGCEGGDNTAYEIGFGTCAQPIPITCGQTISEDLLNGINTFQFFENCNNFFASGNELVFTFTLNQPSDVMAKLTNIITGPSTTNRDSFMTIYILSECGNSSCLATEADVKDNFVTASLAAGTYFILVDDVTGQITPFDLTLTCTNSSAPNINTQNKPLSNSLSLEVAPNPFNFSTTIDFNVPITSRINLFISDMTGRRVQTVKKQEWLTSGKHSLKWNNINMPSGIYFLHLELNGQFITKKIVLTP